MYLNLAPSTLSSIENMPINQLCSFCAGLKFKGLGFEPDKQEDISDLEKMLNPPKPVTSEKTVGRNDPCPCGSGKKFKKCCGANDLLLA